VRIVLNGEPFEVDGPLTIQALLQRLTIDPRGVAVEHNTVVVKRTAYAEVLIHEGDQVEIVHFVGGG
jgi:thiamine biosynthesis protein ThiS